MIRVIRENYHGVCMSDQSVESVLTKLTADTATQWQVVGEVLCDLERMSGVSLSGDTWQEVVAEKLAALGHPVSQGHLYKVRRSYAFAVHALPYLELPNQVLANAKISAVEVAERLYRLDTDAGYDALKACADEQNPATGSEIKRLYESFLERHPERRNPKQVAWVERKKPGTQNTNELSDGEVYSVQEPAVADKPTAGSLTDHLLGAEAWLTVLQPVISKLHDMEVNKRKQNEEISRLEEENEELRREIKEARQHEQLASEALKDVRMELVKSQKYGF